MFSSVLVWRNGIDRVVISGIAVDIFIAEENGGTLREELIYRVSLTNLTTFNCIEYSLRPCFGDFYLLSLVVIGVTCM